MHIGTTDGQKHQHINIASPLKHSYAVFIDRKRSTLDAPYLFDVDGWEHVLKHGGQKLEVERFLGEVVDHQLCACTRVAAGQDCT